MVFPLLKTVRSSTSFIRQWFEPKSLALIVSFPVALMAFEGNIFSGKMPPNGALAQINPNPEIFGEPPFNRSPRPRTPVDATTAPSSTDDPTLIPDETITPVQGQVSIRFVNLTGAEIAYQVIDVTEYRTLAGRAEMMLQNLDVPTTLTFRRQDNGFLLVKLEAKPTEAGVLTVTVRETPNFGSDRTSIYIDPAGEVYLN
ncbi:MAG: hypothetical protein HY785_13350 [Oscillatoriophycideae cyanobacterium NC_groundwater_1537_Pr4_S-0.65um_50_18]|nr:hypothetical protein [Oscillatoriophycideae cyanobacterium NC_groundwater_1537_Pr4_S-0.65um_50_18]